MRAMFDGFNCRVVARNYSTIQGFKSSTLNGFRKLKLGFAKSQISLIFAFVNYHLIWISAQK